MTGTLPPLEECRSLQAPDSACGSDGDGEPAHVDLRAATPASSPFGAAAQTSAWMRPPGADVKPARPSVDWGGAAAFHRSPAVPPEGYPMARASFDLGPRLGKPENSRQVSGVASESKRSCQRCAHRPPSRARLHPLALLTSPPPPLATWPAVNDLMPLATDPKVRSRLEKHTAACNGRMSRKDILKVVESEMSGELRLGGGFGAGCAARACVLAPACAGLQLLPCA